MWAKTKRLFGWIIKTCVKRGKQLAYSLRCSTYFFSTKNKGFFFFQKHLFTVWSNQELRPFPSPVEVLRCSRRSWTPRAKTCCATWPLSWTTWTTARPRRDTDVKRKRHVIGQEKRGKNKVGAGKNLYEFMFFQCFWIWLHLNVALVCLYFVKLLDSWDVLEYLRVVVERFHFGVQTQVAGRWI